MRVCVIIPTYRRTKKGIQGPPLRRALETLKRQTFRDFTVYVCGDHYDDAAEFDEICDGYDGRLFRINLGPAEHFRNALRGQPRKLWQVGGAAAVLAGVEQAIKDGMDWYLHLDDDDSWSPDHVETYVREIRKAPSVSFICSKTRMKKDKILPTQRIVAATPNNYRPKPCDSIHASWALRLDTLGGTLLKHYGEERDWVFHDQNKIQSPSDMRLLAKLRDMPIDTMCLPTMTVSYSGVSRAK